MEVVDDVCESEGVCEVMCNVLSDQPEQGESMEMHETEEEAAKMSKSASTEDLSTPAQDPDSTRNAPPRPQYTYRLVSKKIMESTMLR